ncbi:hypothetical protein HOC01_01895 [archaeon]|jgi:hypothetical protein|nr:hypothetical protein [archaeon]MBT6697927.1 hypothetical protein [archaeon]
MNYKTITRIGTIAGLYNSPNDLSGDVPRFNVPVASLRFDIGGIIGSTYHGVTTSSKPFRNPLIPEGTLVRNTRQWLAISQAELDTIHQRLCLSKEETLEARMLGANMLIEPDQGDTFLSRFHGYSLVISPDGNYQGGPVGNDAVVLEGYAGAMPCKQTGKKLAKHFGDETLKTRFKPAALIQEGERKQPIRGLVGSVLKGGKVQRGQFLYALKPTGFE